MLDLSGKAVGELHICQQQYYLLISHLTPDDKSEIVALYSSHVIVACQLSLQSKQKVKPHWKMKFFFFHFQKIMGIKLIRK